MNIKNLFKRKKYNDPWVEVKSPSGRRYWMPLKDLESQWGKRMGFKKI